MPNQPEITAPVSRGLNASIGIVANYGTSLGSSTGGVQGVGSSNGSVGGLRDNGTSSFQNAAKNPTATIKDPNNTPSSSVVTSSANPQSIQDDSSSAADNSEYVSRVFTQNPNGPGAGGYHSNLPKAVHSVEMPSNTGFNKNYASTLGGNDQNLKGLETSITFGSVNDINRLANDFNEVKLNSNKKLDGAKSIGSPEPQPRNETIDGVNSNNIVGGANAVAPNLANKAQGAGQFTGIQP